MRLDRSRPASVSTLDRCTGISERLAGVVDGTAELDRNERRHVERFSPTTSTTVCPSSATTSSGTSSK